MVYGMVCGSVVIWNAGVRGVRLWLAVARGAHKCVGRIRAELWSSVDPESGSQKVQHVFSGFKHEIELNFE